MDAENFILLLSRRLKPVEARLPALKSSGSSHRASALLVTVLVGEAGEGGVIGCEAAGDTFAEREMEDCRKGIRGAP